MSNSFPLWFWLLFGAIIVAILVFDLGYLNRKAVKMTFKRSISLAGFYFSIAIAFGGGVWWYHGTQDAALFYTAYLLEQSLSFDNVFVISLIFSYFAIPENYRHHVLFWGIIMAMVLRGVFIGFGVVLVSSFSWLLYIFAAFLLYSGYHMLKGDDEENDMSENKVIRFLQKHLPVHPKIEGEAFIVKCEDENGELRRYVTPLFIAFMSINFIDLIFAVDSIPAVLSLTQDPFIVYTSNIFAVLGLRTLYFVIESLVAKFHLLKKSLALLLVLIGLKIIYDHNFPKIDPVIALVVTIMILLGGIIASVLFPKPEATRMSNSEEKK